MLQKLLRNFSTNFGHIDPCLSSLLIWWQTTTALANWINRLLSPTFEHHFIVRSMKRGVRLEKHYIWVNQEWATYFETVIMRNMLTEKINLFELLILWSVSRARQSAKKVVKNLTEEPQLKNLMVTLKLKCELVKQKLVSFSCKIMTLWQKLQLL